MPFSLHKGSVDEPEGGAHLLGTFRDGRRRALEMEHLSLYGSSVRGTWREASFAGDTEEYVKKESGSGHLPPYGPRSGTVEVTLLYWGFDRKVRFCFIKKPCL
jgi:hypothetical protein